MVSSMYKCRVEHIHGQIKRCALASLFTSIHGDDGFILKEASSACVADLDVILATSSGRLYVKT